VPSIVPPGTACVGVPLPLNAITTPPQGSIVWSVSPAGPTFTQLNQNPTNFVSDSLGIFNIGYVFTDNNGCIDSADIDICVQPQPNASFTVNTTAGCLPLAVTTTNNSNTLNTCGNTTYNWQVIFDGAECHNGTGMWNFAPGSTAASLSPAFNFTQSGVYRLVLTVTNNCGTSSSTTTITVGEAPQGLTIAPIANVCDTLFLAPTGQAQACNASGLTLTWYLDGVLFPNPPGIGVGIDGLHTVELVATNVCGADTLPTNFTIYPLPPVPVVTYNGPVCERSTLTFTVSSPTGPNLEYCWTRPGGLPDTCMTNPVFNIPNATPANAGLYTLTVRNLSTLPVCENSTNITAVVNPAPPIILQADTVRICSKQSGTIQVTNIQTGYTYAWSSPNSPTITTGSVVVVPPATVNVQTTLTYTVTVTDALGCTNTAMALVIVNPLPVLSIVPPGTACEGEPLPLSANVSVQGIGIWSSNPTGPTFTPTNQNPTVFNSSFPGVFNVEYTLTDNNGCMNSADTNIQVQPLPMITTSVIPSGNCVPVTISLTNQPAAGITYTWNFGDGSVPVIGTNPGSYTYSVPGIYTITMTAADVFGCSRTINFSPIQVNPVPTSGFVLAPTVDCAIPQTLCLNDASSGATIYNWTSTPSVGAIASVNSPCITINAEDTYSIKQEVRNQFGCVDSTTLSYTAYDTPVAAFSVSGDTSGCENLAILFDNQSEHADFWTWRFDGLVDSFNWSPSHVFDDPGQYTISLTVGNGSGCTDTRTRTSYIEVYPKPVANFDYLLLDNEWLFTFRFRDKSTTDATLFGWNFGENSGIDSEERNPKYRYLSASNRVITHWVENTFGCVDTTSLPLSIDLTGDLFVPNILEPLNQDHPEKQVFLPKGYNLSQYHIAVFARTGQLIWESTQLDTDGQPVESWDGTLNGEPLPGGVFVWKVLQAKFIDGRDWNGMLDENKTKRKSNFLYLIR
jgi:PKD repeat protein